MVKSGYIRLLIGITILIFSIACSIPGLPRKSTATLVPSVKPPVSVSSPVVPTTPGSNPQAVTPTRLITTQAAATKPAASEAPKSPSSEFPLPKDAKSVMAMPDGVNFQTGMNLKDAMAFYRETYTKQGLKERALLTVTSEKTFSMVFDYAANGKSIVIQGVDLGNNTTNINIRYEKV